MALEGEKLMRSELLTRKEEVEGRALNPAVFEAEMDGVARKDGDSCSIVGDGVSN